MLKKLTILFLTYLFLSLAGCWCDPAPPHFDFKEINVLTYKNEITYNDSLQFQIETSQQTFLTQQLRSLVPVNSAMATSSCPEPGEQGLKYAITKIRITSNHDFDSTHLKGQLLNDLIHMDSFGTAIPVSDSLLNSSILFYHPYSLTHFTLTQSPTLDSIHTFQFEFTKSNGNSVSGLSEEIIWVQ